MTQQATGPVQPLPPGGPEVVDPENALPPRVAQGVPNVVFRVLVLSLSAVCLAFVLDLTFVLGISFFQEQYYGLLYGLVFAAGFLRLPGHSGAATAVPWYDYVLALLGLCVGLYIFLLWPQIVSRVGTLTPDRVAVSAIGVALILELTRRAFGWPLVVLTALFMAYALYRYLIPGPFGGRGTNWRRLVAFVFTDSESILGIIAGVVFGMVFAFMLFGRALFVAGGGKFFTDLSISAMGHRRGGSAKVAVIASSIFGTLSGSASSNVVVTGSITIPMMIRTGYSRASAAAIEAVSSSGGGLMPPVMGATAFLMAEFLAVPYREVVIAALLPALLFYLTLFVQVDLEAGKLNLRGLDRSEIPRVGTVLRVGWVFLIPLAALIYCLFVIFLSPSKSALVAFVVVVAVSLFGPSRLGPRRILEALENTGSLMIEMGILAAIAGVIVGVINLTGIGLLFSQELLSLAGGSLFLLLVLTGATSIILGMSMPVTASYVILAVIAAPAIESAGVPAIAAHLFIFYFAVLSFITPPVCVAVFVAATIARAPAMQTAMIAVQFAIVAFIVPFVFVYDQLLLMQGAWYAVAAEFAVVSIGFVAIAVAFQGHLLARVGVVMRLVLLVAGLGAVVPSPEIKLPGLAVATVALIALWLAGRRAGTALADAAR
jgi:TRAP transporter 4TM/12TM fusion protein